MSKRKDFRLREYFQEYQKLRADGWPHEAALAELATWVSPNGLARLKAVLLSKKPGHPM